MRLPFSLRGAQALVTDSKGRPVAARHRYGQGEALFFGTALTLGYHRHCDPQAGEWIAAPARPYVRDMRVSATSTAPRLLFRGLNCPQGTAAILANPGPECHARVAFRGSFREILEVLTAQKYKVAPSRDINEIKVRIPAGGGAVLLAISATPAPR